MQRLEGNDGNDMALINVNLDEAEQKLVAAIEGQILPQIVNEVTKQIIPALTKSLEGLHIEVKLTCDISRKPDMSHGPPLPPE